MRPLVMVFVVGWLSTAMGLERPLVGDDQGETDGQTAAGVKETQEG